VYGLMAVMGVVSILAIQALVSAAIFNHFRTHHADGMINQGLDTV
jgi:hypothetical protein